MMTGELGGLLVESYIGEEYLIAQTEIDPKEKGHIILMILS